VKRGKPLTADPAKVAAFNQRGRGSLKRPKVKPVDPERVIWQRAWGRQTKRKPCAMCGSYIGVQGHHVIPLQVLKREGVPDWLWWDTRNHLALCAEPSPERCHQRHELHVKRVPRDVVLAGAPRALVFANEVGLLHIFDREYPA
jgi:hypothetical protein